MQVGMRMHIFWHFRMRVGEGFACICEGAREAACACVSDVCVHAHTHVRVHVYGCARASCAFDCTYMLAGVLGVHVHAWQHLHAALHLYVCLCLHSSVGVPVSGRELRWYLLGAPVLFTGALEVADGGLDRVR
jgi:hypothetical protein